MKKKYGLFISILFFSMFYSCASRYNMDKGEYLEYTLHDIKNNYFLKNDFSGTGTIYLKTKKISGVEVGFDCIAFSDTALNLKLHHAIFGNVGEIILNNKKYSVRSKFIKNKISGIYSDSSLIPQLGISLPLKIFYSIFTACPYVPFVNYDSISVEKNIRTFFVYENNINFEFGIDDEKLNPVYLSMYKNHKAILEIRWKKYKEKTPQFTEVSFADGGRMIVYFNKIRK